MKLKLAFALLMAAGFVMAAEVKVPVRNGVVKITGAPKNKNNSWRASGHAVSLKDPAGKKIKISADIKTVITPGTKGIFQFKLRELKNQNGKQTSLRYVGTDIKKSQDWQKVTSTHVIHKDAVAVQIFLVASNMDDKSYGEAKNITWEIIE